MILQNITIVNLGAIDYFSHDFADDVNLLKVKHTNEIFYAVQVILNHKDIPPLPQYAVRADSRIAATIFIEKKQYKMIALPDTVRKCFLLKAYNEQGEDVTNEYRYLTDHCAEQDLCDVFDKDAKKMFFKPIQYLDEDRYYSSGDLSRCTDRLSEIKAFRSYLKTFIKDFTPETIRDGKRYELYLKKDGRYAVRYKGDNDMPVFLSESEQTLFRYLCFLRTAEFWHGFEELRNLHALKKPLLVKDFLSRLDESINIESLLQRTTELKRQVIILN